MINRVAHLMEPEIIVDGDLLRKYDAAIDTISGLVEENHKAWERGDKEKRRANRWMFFFWFLVVWSIAGFSFVLFA